MTNMGHMLDIHTKLPMHLPASTLPIRLTGIKEEEEKNDLAQPRLHYSY